MNITITITSMADLEEVRMLLNQLPKKIDADTSASIDTLALSVRVANCLKAESIGTIGQLTGMTPYELRKIPNFGRLSLDELRKELARAGLSLKGDK